MYSILIVDDETYIRQGLKKFLAWDTYGFIIAGEAPNGIEARSIYDKTPVDVIITDIKMPGMNGFDLIDSFTDFGNRPYFIILSGYSEFEFARKAIERSVVHYLLKPLQENELIAVITKIKNKLDKTAQIHQESKITSEILARCRAGDSRKVLSEMILFLEKNMAQNLTLEILSKQFRMNSNYICQLFKKQLGMNFLELLISIRMEKAKLLLSDLTLKIYDVSYMVGYEDSRYFSQLFRKHNHMTPSEFREKE